MGMSKVEKTAVLAIIVCLGLVVLKYTLARISGSIALVADTWHSISDVFVSILVLVGARIHRKGWRFAAILENIIALLIAGMIFTAAYFLAVKSITGIGYGEIFYLPIVLAGTVVSAAISRLIGKYEIRVGTKEKSPSMIADGYHSIMDVYTTAVVTIGLLGHMIGLKLDTIAAIIVVLFVIEVGIEITVMSVKGLIRNTAFSIGREHKTANRVLSKIGKPAGLLIKLITGYEPELSKTAFNHWLARRKKKIVATVIVLGAAFYVGSGFFFVNPEQGALVSLFGKASEKVYGPGLHFALPAPFGKVYKVDTKLERRLESGFRSIDKGPADSAPISRSSYEWHSLHLSGIYNKEASEAIMLTGDENLIDLNAVIKYKVSNPHDFLFRFNDQELLVRCFVEDVLRSIVSITPIDDILTESRKKIEKLTKEKLQAEADNIRAGITITSIDLQDVHPPVEVVNTFREVSSAKEEKALTINEALADRNEKIPQARAEATALKLEALAYRASKVENAKGEGGRFTALASEVRTSRDVTSYRLYIQTMEKVLAGKRKFIVSPDLEPGALDLRIFARGQTSSSQSKTKKKK